MGSEHLPRASGLAASLKAAVGRGAGFGMALLVVRVAEGCGRRVFAVAIEGVGGWALNLPHRCVHHLGAAAEASGVARSAVGMRDEMVDGT